MLRKWRLGAGLFSLLGLISFAFGLGSVALAQELHQSPPIQWNASGYGSDDCRTLSAGQVLWHFVHTQTDGDNLPATLTATFDPGGPVTVDGYSHGGGNAVVMYDVITGRVALTGASDHITGVPAKEGDLLNLSSICVGPPPAKANPSISTTQLPSSTAIGGVLKDSATLSHGNSPTGSITFYLNDAHGNNVYHEVVTGIHGNGTYTTAHGFTSSAVGTFYWVATYNGDDNNNSVSSGAHDEPVTVDPADPSLSTTQDPTGGLIGAKLQDSAQLNHGYNPTGTITFHLLNPSGTDVHHETVAVDGNGSYATSEGFVANTAGTWQWWAEYSGDVNNNAKHTQVGAEPVVITSEPVTPTIRTTPVPASAVVGDVLKDTATLGGTIDATGHITFELFDPNGHSAYHVTVDVTKYHTEYTTPDGFIAYGPGTWYWVASYSGDENNHGVTSGAHEEPVTVEKATPTITTSTNPDSGFVGTTMQDSATLTGYHPTGTITFFLNNPSGVNVYHETVNVTGGSATYSTTHGFAADSVGIWHWWAEYNGDANNNKVHSVATDEPVIIREQGSEPVTPTIKTTPIPQSAAVQARLKDSATLAGGDNPSGTIVFTLLRPNGVAAYTETVTVSGNGTYTTPTGFIADVGGTWHWMAAYSGDLKNNAVVSDPADEPVVVAVGGVLAETAMTTPFQAAAMAIFVFGLMAMVAGGALAWRRREA